MPSQTTEAALEACIERHLTGGVSVMPSEGGSLGDDAGHKKQDEVDALLESVDLSTYGLERVRLNQHTELDSAETEIDPDNPNVRGFHNDGDEELPLDEIIRHFNERWFSAWDATPEEQRVKLTAIAESVRESAVYKTQVEGNSDEQNRKLAQESIIGEIVRNSGAKICRSTRTTRRILISGNRWKRASSGFWRCMKKAHRLDVVLSARRRRGIFRVGGWKWRWAPS